MANYWVSIKTNYRRKRSPETTKFLKDNGISQAEWNRKTVDARLKILLQVLMDDMESDVTVEKVFKQPKHEHLPSEDIKPPKLKNKKKKK